MDESQILSNSCTDSVGITNNGFQKGDFDQTYILADISDSSQKLVSISSDGFHTDLHAQDKPTFLSHYPEVPLIVPEALQPNSSKASDITEVDNSTFSVLTTVTSNQPCSSNLDDLILENKKNLSPNALTKQNQEQPSTANPQPAPKILKKVFKLPDGPAPKGLKKIKNLIAIYHCKLCGYLTKSKELMDEHSKKHKVENETKAAPKVKRKRRTKKEMIALRMKKEARKMKKEKGIKKEKNNSKKEKGDDNGTQDKKDNSGKGTKKKRGPRKPKEEITVIDGKVYCPDCSFFTTNLQSLKVHRLMHLKERPYKCTVCDFHGKDLKELIRHHDGGHIPGVFVCKDCGFLTNDRSRFDTHRESHTGHLPYKCSVCPHKTMLKAAHKIHMETHGIQI